MQARRFPFRLETTSLRARAGRALGGASIAAALLFLVLAPHRYSRSVVLTGSHA